jgi:hypothetical protein
MFWHNGGFLEPLEPSGYATAPSGNIKSDRRVPVGFLLVFRIHRSSSSCRSQVIIDFQPSNIKPEVEAAVMWRHIAEPS